MKTKQYLLILSFILLGLLFVSCTAATEPAANNTGTEPDVTDDAIDNTAVALPNPASVHCTEQGGVLEMRTDENGSQYGVCLFNDGSECEEWAFFRGECAPGNTQLFDTVWALQSYGGQPPLADTTPTLTIDSDWQLGGSTGCNSFFSSVTRDGDTWTVSPVGSTQMWCEGVMDQETAVVALLQTVASHTLAAGSLTLHAPDGDLVYAPATHAALEGTSWTLNSIVQDDAVVSTALDATITMLLVDGKLSGYTGCNDYFGSYIIEGNSLTLSALSQTRRACDEEQGKREMELMTALAQVAAYETELDTLRLLDGNGRLLITLTTANPTQ